MVAADVEARRTRVHKGDRNPRLDAPAQQILRVTEAERNRHEVRDGCQRHVALAKTEANPGLAIAVHEHDAFGIHRRCVGTRTGFGEREARHVVTARELWEVPGLLVLGAVMLDQLRGAERVWNDDVRAKCGRVRVDLTYNR